MSRARDGVNGCLCCGLRYVEDNGFCDLCNNRGHDQDPRPAPPAAAEQRAQGASPRDRQIREPGRDR